MTEQTTEPLKRMSGSPTHRPVEFFVHKLSKGRLVVDANYQRGAVWTPGQRRGLIRSFIQNIPIPAIIINNRLSAGWHSEVDYAVIDGRQRVETMAMWFASAFPIPASWKPEWVARTTDTDDGPYVTFDQLTGRGQRFFDNDCGFACVEATVKTLAEEAEIFELVNGGGTPQTDTDMARARRVAEGK